MDRAGSWHLVFSWRLCTISNGQALCPKVWPKKGTQRSLMLWWKAKYGCIVPDHGNTNAAFLNLVCLFLITGRQLFKTALWLLVRLSMTQLLFQSLASKKKVIKSVNPWCLWQASERTKMAGLWPLYFSASSLPSYLQLLFYAVVSWSF